MWRGQSDIDWGLNSSAYRRLKASSNYQTNDVNENISSYETTLLQQATHRGFRQEGSRELTDFELLAKLQHHGAATRLVDFSRNALIGIWFACNENPDKSGFLAGFDSWYLEGYEKEPETRSYKDVIDALGDKNPVTWEPPGVSSRIAVQHSQFIYSKVIESPSGSLITPDDDKAYRRFEITKKVKAEALEVLFEVFDISRANVFPDIDGFSQANSVNEDISSMHRW